MSYTFLHRMGGFSSPNSIGFQSQSWYSEWRLGKILQELSSQYQLSDQEQNDITNKIYTLIGLKDWYKEIMKEGFLPSLKKLMSKPEI